MEPLILKSRQPVESPGVERWDDDDDFDNLDDFHFRTASTATSVVSQSQTRHRDSISSRLSIRSDSNQGDESWDVLVGETDSVRDAISIAKSKGIPIPTNVPRSALEGGTIRRLKGKEIKKAITDDWSEDLDLPGFSGPLKLAKNEPNGFPETLRQISAAFQKSPDKSVSEFDQTIKSPKTRTSPAISLGHFRDNDEDLPFGDVPTIRVAKQRSPQKPTLFQPPAPATNREAENIEEGLEIPADGQLKLSARKPLPQTPQQNDDFDLEWAEGSIGIRNAGKTNSGWSNRSSSVSALSPSASSAFTQESEDEGLEGLVLPKGPLKFDEVLKRRQENQSPDQSNYSGDRNAAKRAAAKEDIFSGLEIADGEVFDAAKSTLHRNIKHKRSTSPTKRITTTLNFTTTKTQTTISRLPRYQHERHERARSNLEPVSEIGAPVSRFRRPESRLGGHSAQSSVSSIPAPTPSTPSTPSSRGLRSTESRPDMRYSGPTTTNAQLLNKKRSMPVLNRGINSPTKPPFVRPPSRQEGSSSFSRIGIPRPKTPTERAESRLGDIRRPPIPFLPAGASATQSQHVSIKSARHYRQQGSDGSIEGASLAQRSLSRLAGRPGTPGRRGSLTPAELAAAAKETMTKPKRRRNFGDGTELDVFDDLPTSATLESKFTKQPTARGAPRSLRSKLGLSHFAPSTTSLASTRAGTETPQPSTPLTPVRQDFHPSRVPRFAQDTAASRNAREQRHISTTFHNIRGEPLQPLSTNWKPHQVPPPSSARSGLLHSAIPSPLLLKRKTKLPQKPQLIRPMGNVRPQEVKGMSYNPDKYTWEGNENALDIFDVPEFTPRGSSPINGANTSPSGKPALIANVGLGAQGVQVVGGMVFDPRRMCWLKIAEGSQSTGESNSHLRGGSVQLEEEEDVFAGLEDLMEESESQSVFSGLGGDRPTRRNVSAESDVQDGAGGGAGSGDELLVGEEFDVGPAFVKRQKSEEERWRRKVERWLRKDTDLGDQGDRKGGWRWAVRELALEGQDAAVNSMVGISSGSQPQAPVVQIGVGGLDKWRDEEEL